MNPVRPPPHVTQRAASCCVAPHITPHVCTSHLVDDALKLETARQVLLQGGLYRRAVQACWGCVVYCHCAR